MAGITIVIPVGPQPVYRKYLEDCLQSIYYQMSVEDEILIINDGGEEIDTSVPTRQFRLPWRSGCHVGWNCGIGLAKTEWCLLMGSDDKLLPGCLAACREVIEGPHDPLGYYNLTCELSTGELADLHNNAAMVSRSLWKLLGGFPPEAFKGPDALIISIMLVHLSEHLHQIKKGTPFVWCRQHPEQDTKRTGVYYPVMNTIRDIATANWKPHA